MHADAENKIVPVEDPKHKIEFFFTVLQRSKICPFYRAGSDNTESNCKINLNALESSCIHESASDHKKMKK